MLHLTGLCVLLHTLSPADTCASDPDRLFTSLSLEHRLRRTETGGSRSSGSMDGQDGVPRSIAGTVRGRAAAWATIVLVGGKLALRTSADREGRFLFPQVGAGSHVLFVEVDSELVERWVHVAEDPVSLLGIDIRLVGSWPGR
jgi:hypothetical protein